MEAEQGFEIHSFKEEDAVGIKRLFESVYGVGYPIRVFYDTEELIRANSLGAYYSIVAKSTQGEVIGVEHLFRSAPYGRLYEAGAGLVLKEFRKAGVNKQLLEFAFEDWAPKNVEIEEIFGEPVCNHTHMQKSVVQFRYIETAIEIALMPAEAYSKETGASGRVATLMAFRCYRPRPHRVFLPEMYEKELRFIYEELDDERTLEVSGEALPDAVVTSGEVAVFDFAQVARVAVRQAGGDFEEWLCKTEAQLIAKRAQVIQMWLDAGTPWVGVAAQTLRDHGYFFGGALPRWFNNDGLLMQKVFVDPDFDSIQLHTTKAKEILDIVKADRRESLTKAL